MLIDIYILLSQILVNGPVRAPFIKTLSMAIASGIQVIHQRTCQYDFDVQHLEYFP